MEDDSSSEDVIYEDEILEVISLSDEDEHQDTLEDVSEGMEDIQLASDSNNTAHDQDNNDEEEMTITTFTPLRDDSIARFTGHQGPVFNVSCCSTSPLICSGGQDDKGLVWRLLDNSSPQLMFECTGHKDSVSCSGFSHDGKYVCTSDLSGVIQVRQVIGEEGKLIWQFETSSIEWLTWHNQAHVVFCGTSDGEVWFWRFPSCECKTLPSHGYECTAGTLLPDGKRLCSGYSDGTIKIWDLKNTSQICSLGNQNSPVTCISCHDDGNRLLIGYTSGVTLLVNSNDAKVLTAFPSLDSSNNEEDNRSVESVAFTGGQHQLALVGTVTGRLVAWDLPTQKIRHSIQSEGGVVKMIVCSESVYSCHLDGIVRRWDILTGACQREWHGHSAGILDMTLTNDEKRILTSSDDCTVCIYSNISTETPLIS